MSEKILMRGRFVSWDGLLLEIKSKISGKDPADVSRIIIKPNLLVIESKSKSFSDTE